MAWRKRAAAMGAESWRAVETQAVMRARVKRRWEEWPAMA